MTFKKLMTMTAVSVLALAGSAMAADYTATQSGDFNDPDTWGGGGAPSSCSDTFSISDGIVVTVTSSVSCGAGQIDAGGVLYIDGVIFTACDDIDVEGELYIDNGTLQTSSDANERVLVAADATVYMLGGAPKITVRAPDGFVLNASTSTLQVDPSTSNNFAEIDAQNSGSVLGNHNDATILIDSASASAGNFGLLLNARLHGRLKVLDGGGAGTSKFRNEADVIADSSGGTLRIGPGVVVEDIASAGAYRWVALKPSGAATLQVDNSSSITIAGDMKAVGNMVFSNASSSVFFRTTGTYRFEVGAVLTVGTNNGLRYDVLDDTSNPDLPTVTTPPGYGAATPGTYNGT